MSTAFVAGATGYTGRALVPVLVERGLRTVAHVRPDSSGLPRWRARFVDAGAEVDITAWDPGAMATTMARLRPTHVFALLGTTRRRAHREGMTGTEAYDRVDYGLTAMLVEALGAADLRPRFVYLSAAGVRKGSSTAYIAVRWRMEETLRGGHVPYTIARPSFITGPGRDEPRVAERLGAAVLDGVLGVVGALGGQRARERYRSTTNSALARALCRIALDPAAENTVVESEELRDG